MIAIKLMGGLGNQMFQYATARHLAQLHNTEVRLDVSWFSSIDEKDTQRSYELDQFKLAQNFLQPHSFLLVEPKILSVHNTLRRLRHYKKPALSHIKEPHFHYDPSILKVTNNSYLDGYWQSYKYFQDSRAVLLQDFSFREKPRPKVNQLIQTVQKENSVALHIRRGDYVSNVHAAAFHGVVDLSYYQKACDLIARKHKGIHVYVFSDDPSWCKQHLSLSYPVSFIPEKHSGAEDMQIMSNCKHVITANSSFSWWGAWLNTNSEKMVISPKRWFQNSNMDSRDLVPKDWIRL